MKRFLWLVVSILIVGFMPVSLAEDEVIAQVRFDSPIGMDRENPRVLVLEDTLYVFNRKEGRIMSWKTGEDSMKAYSSLPVPPIGSFELPYGEMSDAQRAEVDRMVTHVIAGDGKLWGLNQFTGKFGQITGEGIDDYEYALDLSRLNEKDRADKDMLYTGFVSNGSLYLFSVLYGKDAFLAQYDLATGARQDVSIRQEGWASSYRPGRAFYVVNVQSMSSSGGYAEKLYELDLATGALVPSEHPPLEKTKREIFFKGVYPLEGTDGICYCMETTRDAGIDYQVFVSEHGGAFRKVLELSKPWNTGIYYLCQPISGGRVLAVDNYGATVLDISKASGGN